MGDGELTALADRDDRRLDFILAVPARRYAELVETFRGLVFDDDGLAESTFAGHLGNLPVEVPCHEPLPQQFHAMHLCLDAAPAVVSAPSSRERATEVIRGAQDLVSGLGASGGGRPWFRILAGRNNRMGTSIRDGIVAACHRRRPP